MTLSSHITPIYPQFTRHHEMTQYNKDPNFLPVRRATGPSLDWWKKYFDTLKESPTMVHQVHTLGISHLFSVRQPLPPSKSLLISLFRNVGQPSFVYSINIQL